MAYAENTTVDSAKSRADEQAYKPGKVTALLQIEGN